MNEFKIGNAGKQKGTLDHKWYSVMHWYNELRKDWDKLTPNQRASYSIELMKMLSAKMKSMPIDPDESKLNADEMMDQLKQIESRTQPIKPPVT